MRDNLIGNPPLVRGIFDWEKMEEVKYYDHDDTPIFKFESDDDGGGDDEEDDDVDDYYDGECESDGVKDYYDEECDSDCEFDLRKRRPIYLSITDDDAHEFLVKMKSLFDLDDLDGDLDIVEPYTMEPRLCPSFVVKLITDYGAVKCATALLQLQTCVSVDLNIPFKDGTYPLCRATEYFDYNMVELYLRHGARTDVTDEIKMESNLLPLKAALESLNMHLYLYDWTPEASIYKLVIILCLPQMKVALETIGLLALSTKHLDEIFLDFAKEGKLIEMAVLLLVANELVIKDGAMHHTPVSQGLIHEIIMGDSLSQGDAEIEVSVCNDEKRDNLDPLCKARRAAFTLILLKIFERTGKAIQSYLRSRQSQVVPKEVVVKDVASILNEAGFLLKKKDMDLSNIDCESDIIKSATGTSENTTPHRTVEYSYMILQSLSEIRAKRREGWVLIKDVAFILKEAGFVFNGKDIDLMSNLDCEDDEIKEALRRSAYKPEKYSDTLPGIWDDGLFSGKLNPTAWPPKHKVYPRKVVKSSSSFNVLTNHCFRPLRSFAVFQLQKNQFKGEKNIVQRRMLRSQLRSTSSHQNFAVKRV